MFRGDSSSCPNRARFARQWRRRSGSWLQARPVDYGVLGAYLAESRGLSTFEIAAPYSSTWLDNTKAKFLLDWRPRYDLKRLTDAPWD